MRLLLMSGVMFSLVACEEGDDKGNGSNSAPDADGDGFNVIDDCDDNNADINPDAEEICDEIDNNCDGDVDSGLGLTIYADTDGDGYGNEGSAASSCEIPDGYAAEGGDCDDTDALIYPGAEEFCNGLDEDCDGTTDNNATDARSYYVDGDGDGVGDTSTEVVSCVRPTDYVELADDCDDTNSDVFPGNSEACDGIDNDCDKKTTDHGSVAFEDRSGEVSNLTDIFNSGNTNYPARYYIDKPGTLTFCGGSWKGALVIDADVEVYGVGGSGNNTLDAAEEFESIMIKSGARDVYIEGVTFRRGDSKTLGFENNNRRSGGGLYCNTGANIEINDVVIKEANAEAGGGLYLNNCPMVMRDSVIEQNTAVYGGGIAIEQGTFEMIDSSLFENHGNLYGGGVYLYSIRGAITFTMTDSWIEDNTANYYGGVYFNRYYSGYNIDMSCNASGSGSGGIIGNSDTYYGAMYLYQYYGGTFTSNGCDFGADGSSRDNSPYDIYHYRSGSSGYYTFEDNQTFTCSTSRSCN